ncbi:MAG TPA: hypothetical protein VIB62_10165 [Actinomycetota bacterium]|jgi:hypothetical protein
MEQRETSGWAIGWTYFAGFMMIVIGAFHAIAGLSAILNDDLFVLGKEYVFKFDITTWGWIHLLLGIVIVLAGFGVFSGAVWARTVGVILAMISAIAAFAWIPWYPIWSIVMIAVAISVIWALTAHGRDVTRV